MKKPKQRKWIIKGASSDFVLRQKYNDVMADLFFNRGILDEKRALEFINPDFTSLSDPFLMPDMKKAVIKIVKAAKNKDLICVYGDYDVDGITATALIVKLLNLLNAKYEWYIPSRFNDGYGLNKKVIQAMSKRNVKLIISVDCGITAVEEVSYGNSKGIEFIITDHHEVPQILPKAFAIIHPALSDSLYSFKNLAGVGVAFKLAQAVVEHINYAKKEDFLKWNLDLVALGTISDLVPLIDENRILAFYGLIVLSKTKNIGLQELYKASSIDSGIIDSYKVGYIIAPRLNAAGRMSLGAESLELLLTGDISRAKYLAAHLSKLNTLRQEKTKEIFAEARNAIEALPQEQKFIVLASKKWSSGIIGIVASKITNDYFRPTILLEEHESLLRGSARSIEGLDLYDFLKDCDELLENFGGHKMAAGLSMKKDLLEVFSNKIEELAKRKLSDDNFIPSIFVDANIGFEQIQSELWEGIQSLAPFGSGNPIPLFASYNLLVKSVRLVGTDSRHVKFSLQDKEGHMFDGIGFDKADHNLNPGQMIDVCYKLHENNWNGKKSLELMVVDLCIRS